MDSITVGDTLRTLLTIAWLLPLVGFVIEIFAGYWSTRLSKTAAYIAVGCIGTGFLCSAAALFYWGHQTGWSVFESHGHDSHAAAHADAGHADPGHAADPHANSKADEHTHAVVDKKDEHGHPEADKKAASIHEAKPAAAVATADPAKPHHNLPKYFSGTQYVLVDFPSGSFKGPTGSSVSYPALRIALDYYIDSLTLVMFTMVTLIASLIHIFAIGYMSEELTENYADHQVHTSHGHLHRPGRFYRFFAFLSLFCFSMLGLVLAGNIFQVFIFWELVGVCSYFLIGFYTERKSASNAANKAFIMNRVGDFGFLIGLMVLWTWFGTFQFSSYNDEGALKGSIAKQAAPQDPGLFQMARGADGKLEVDHPANGPARVLLTTADDIPLTGKGGQQRSIPYYLLIVAGLGIFGGCIGKSAQFPLQTWLPDAMEGPTPVSALVHSATMVAAGVYLAGRFYPMFTPEVLLTIAYIGCITLFLAATIAVVATDIKKVLAYSTISQLGYMMLAIGVGGWAAGLFHLITHAFFKSLMFLASGSVIYGCHHVQEMPQMGGLLKKMPITAMAMLVGVIAISGLAIPGSQYILGEVIAFSGYHSKDAIVATALTHSQQNPAHFLLFLMPLMGAGITAFYMFRLWFYTFAGEPRDHHVYEHAHESPRVMTIPLFVLSVFAIFCAIGGEEGPLFKLLLGSEPAGVAAGVAANAPSHIALPSHAAVHANHSTAGMYALLVAALGAGLAYVFYGARLLNPADVRRQFASLHSFLVDKWAFDELYDFMFVRPSHIVASWCAWFDKNVIDALLHHLAAVTVWISTIDRRFDEQIVDGLVNWVADVTYNTGSVLRLLQTGRLRQYVMFIVVGVVGIWLFVWLMVA